MNSLPDTIPSELLYKHLFLVDGELVEHYNRALKAVVGKETALTSFLVDKRGESPEVEAELGRDYLQLGPAHRFAIVVSPDQRKASLIHPEFSYDSQVMDFAFSNFLPTIDIATRLDGLSGELDDDVRSYDTLEDLLLVRRIHVELHTPSGFMHEARQLQEYVKQLEANPQLLIEDNSAVPKRILALAKNVGDVRGLNLNPIDFTIPIDSFYTRLFDGVYVFRSHPHVAEPLPIARPGKDVSVIDDPLEDLFMDKDLSSILTSTNKTAVQGSSELDDIFGELVTSDDSKEAGILGELSPKDDANFLDFMETPKQDKKKTREQIETTVIYHQNDVPQPVNAPKVTYIPLQSVKKVVDFLVGNNFAAYDLNRIPERLNQLEDISLLANGVDVANLNKNQRQKMLLQYHHIKRDEWNELVELQRGVAQGHDIDCLLKKMSPESRVLLLKPRSRSDCPPFIIENLLTKLWPHDYALMAECNPRDLKYAYTGADENTRRYILQQLQTR